MLCAAWTADGQHLALGMYHGLISICDKCGVEQVHVFSFSSHTSAKKLILSFIFHGARKLKLKGNYTFSYIGSDEDYMTVANRWWYKDQDPCGRCSGIHCRTRHQTRLLLDAGTVPFRSTIYQASRFAPSPRLNDPI